MELSAAEHDLFTQYLSSFDGLVGDRRTRALLGATVRGIIGAESLRCSRIAAFSPALAAGRHGERRIRRMLHGETTKRSSLDADVIVQRLQARGVEQLRGEPAIWVIVDGSDLRKPQAQAMEALQRVTRLDGRGTVPGYKTLNAIGVGRQRRGLLYHRLFSSRAEGARHQRRVWLVEVRLEGACEAPWWLLTDRPVMTAEEATAVFRMCRQRWAIEDAFNNAEQCLGWEGVQLLAFAAVRLLVALGWAAAGFLYELGVTLEWAEVRLLTRLGGGEVRANRPPGKIVLTRGLRRLLDLCAAQAILEAEIQQYSE
jgi:hypothetical protein